MTTWLKDDHGNEASVKYFGSEAAAQAALDSLKDCKDCINCRRCFHCSDCSGCFSCYNCRRCSGCSGCSGCSRCDNCSNCSRCSRCHDCHDCSECSGKTDEIGVFTPPAAHDGGHAAPALKEALENCKEFFEVNTDKLFGEGHDIPMAVGASMAIRKIDAALASAKTEGA